MNFRVTAIDLSRISLNESDVVKSVLQNVAIILRTKRGTVPLYREFGLSQDYLARPIIAARPLLHAEISEAITKFEPRAQLERIIWDADPQIPGSVSPTVEVSIVA